jgi:hypothetical protein
MARRKSRQPKLLLVEGQATRQEMAIRLPLSIGREPGQGLVISHPLVSRHHCTLINRENVLWVKDLNSSNGTMVNGRRVHESAVQPGDKITVGPLTFVAVYQPDDLGASARQRADQVIREAREDGYRVRQSPSSTDMATIDTAALVGLTGKTEGEVADDEKIGLFLSWAQQMARGKKKAQQPAHDEGPDLGDADDVAVLVESDREDNPSDSNSALSRTLVATDLNDPALRPQQPVRVRPEEIAESDDEPPSSHGEDSDHSVVELPPDQQALGQLVSQISRFQARVFEHYQQMALTMRLVSRLQQDQLDMLRDELERLCQLNDSLRHKLLGRYRDSERNDGANGNWSSLEEADRKAHESLERLHTDLLRQTTAMQTSARDHWRQVRSAMKEAGIE